MATTNKIMIGIDDQVIELKGEELKLFLIEREKINAEIAEQKAKQEAQKELKISAYKKLGLTDEEINAII